MNQWKNNARGARAVRLLGGAAVAALLSASAGAAFADEPAATPAAAPDAPSNEVVVTGSRIRGVAPVGSNIVTASHEEIVASGAATTGDMLRTIPQIFSLGPSATAASAQNGAANVTRGVGVNLRGIGANATLLLVDGHRMSAAGTQGQFTDASVIPSIALERVEVVPDGASAIYGSDAIAGVVNLILRKSFEGAEVSGRYGFANNYDEWKVSGILGHGWGTGHAMAAFDHTENSPLLGANRSFYSSNQTSRGGNDYRPTTCNPGTLTVNKQLYPLPLATPAVVGPANKCDLVPNAYIIPSQSRNTGIFSIEQEVGESVKIFAEGFYSRRDLVIQDVGVVGTNLSVPSTNPFYAAQAAKLGAALPLNAPIVVNTSFVGQVPIQRNPGHSTSWEVSGGAEFKLGHDWKGVLSGTYGEDEELISRTHNFNAAAAAAALALTDPTTALNVFGGTNNPATLATLTTGAFIIGSNTSLGELDVRADGPVFKLPGGEVRLAVGAEYRHETLFGSLVNGTIASVPILDMVARDIDAGFGELYVPIVGADNAVPGIHRLDLSLAVRYEHYSDAGDTSNPKVGVTWQPVEDLNIRGSYGTSFRAPGLAEVDAHSSGYGLYGDTLPDPTSPTGTSFGIGIAGGNPTLIPETATTWSIGGDFKPKAAPGLHLSATYFSVDYKNQILALRGTSGLLSLSFYSPYLIRNPTPAQVSALLASGQPINTPINAALVTYIQDGRRQNLGETITDGIDFDAGYGWRMAGGRVEADINGTYFTKLTSSPAPGAVVTSVVGLINFPQRFRMRASLGWQGDGVTVRGAVNYLSSYTNNTVTPVQIVSAYTTVDLHMGYDLGSHWGSSVAKNLTVALDIRNLADAGPPFVNINTGYDPQSASPLGRLVAFSIDKKW